jgi:hypothetical protein
MLACRIVLFSEAIRFTSGSIRGSSGLVRPLLEATQNLDPQTTDRLSQRSNTAMCRFSLLEILKLLLNAGLLRRTAMRSAVTLLPFHTMGLLQAALLRF